MNEKDSKLEIIKKSVNFGKKDIDYIEKLQQEEGFSDFTASLRYIVKTHQLYKDFYLKENEGK